MSSVFPPGVQLAAHYRVLRLLETNHVGALYEAERFDAPLAGEGDSRSVTGRRVALKWLRFAAGGAAQVALQRAAHARAASAIRHRHLALVHDVALEGSSLFVVSELLLGESLRARLAPHAMPLHERLRALAEAMTALAFAHQRGLVHGGLHPGNIFLHQPHDPCFGLPAVVKVHDFGTATTTLPQSLAYPGERSPFGPHAYLDHAQLCGAEADARSDIYACGVLLYQALTGTVPFAASGPVELAIKLATTSAAPIGDRLPGLPASLDALVQQALRKERNERPLTLEPLAALTSAYAETLAARELLARGDTSLATRRMIQPLRATAEAARLEPHLPPAERDTRPLAVLAGDASHGNVTRLLTVFGADASALQLPPSASPVPQHTAHPPEFLAALQEAEVAASLDLSSGETATYDAESARPLRHEQFAVPPVVQAPTAHGEPRAAAPVSRHTQRGLATPPMPDSAHAHLQTTMTTAVPPVGPDLALPVADEDTRPDAPRSERAAYSSRPGARVDEEAAEPVEPRAPRHPSSGNISAAIGPSSARVTREQLEQESVVEISRHPTVVGASATSTTARQGYVEFVPRSRARPAPELSVGSPPSVLDEVELGFVSKRVSTWSAAVAAVLVVAGISVSFALATNRDSPRRSTPPALPGVLAPHTSLAHESRPRLAQAEDAAIEAHARLRQHAAPPSTRGDVGATGESGQPSEPHDRSLSREGARRFAGDPDRSAEEAERGGEQPPRARRHSAERARERPQRALPPGEDDGFLVGPLPTADQF